MDGHGMDYRDPIEYEQDRLIEQDHTTQMLMAAAYRQSTPRPNDYKFSVEYQVEDCDNQNVGLLNNT